jgi:hypothetical protein
MKYIASLGACGPGSPRSQTVWLDPLCRGALVGNGSDLPQFPHLQRRENSVAAEEFPNARMGVRKKEESEQLGQG